MPEADVWEIFSAIQGEGLCAGERHTFLRVAGCNLDCRFCDTPARSGSCAGCDVETVPGTGGSRTVGNPVGWEEATRHVLHLVGGDPPSRRVSITGGEPLRVPEFVGAVARALRGVGIGVHLETNGTLPDALAPVCGLFEWIAMDMKLPSAAGGRPRWPDHRRFLEIARARPVFVKLVLTADVDAGDVERAAEIVAGADRRIPVVLQPVTRARDVTESISLQKLREMESVAARRLEDVRVIPQMHGVLGGR